MSATASTLGKLGSLGSVALAGGAGASVVDINTIPNALVERVDVLTGGASALCGADAVSGVVNFIMRDDFEGAQPDFQTNLPDDSGGKNYLLSATVGANFDDGRGSIAANFEYFKQRPLYNTQHGLVSGCKLDESAGHHA